MSNKRIAKPSLLIVGSFPSPNSTVNGGIRTACTALMESTFLSSYKITLIDSTQASDIPTNILGRLIRSIPRLYLFLKQLFGHKPEYAIFFHCDSLSFLEKSLFSTLLHFRGSKTILFPRTNRLINHCQDNIFLKLYAKFSFRLASHILVQGYTFKRYLYLDLAIPEEKVTVVPNWTASHSLLKLGALKLNEKLKSTSPYKFSFKIVYVGWLEENKDVGTLLSSFKLLCESNMHCTLEIVGNGSQLPDLREQAAANKMLAQIIFHGNLHPKNVYSIVSNSDVLVLPSLQEGCPNCVIESMALATPVVSTKVGCLPDFFRHQHDILFCDKKDPKDLYHKIRQILLDKELQFYLATNAHNIVSKSFTVETASISIQKALRSIL